MPTQAPARRRARANRTAGLFHATCEHLAPPGRRLATAVAVARLRELPMWRRDPAMRKILATPGRPCAPGAACCWHALGRWLDEGAAADVAA